MRLSFLLYDRHEKGRKITAAVSRTQTNETNETQLS